MTDPLFVEGFVKTGTRRETLFVQLVALVCRCWTRTITRAACGASLQVLDTDHNSCSLWR